MDNIQAMKSHLIEIEQKALKARNTGRLEEAAKFYEMIVTEMPDWEHGTAVYSLACCYEDLGNISSAENYYRKALQYEPENPTFLGGLASFLDLHGDPVESFKCHVALLHVERARGNESRATSTETALKALAKRMGLSDDEVAESIANL
jgi:Flp pilus assembly protein TadD